MPNVARRIVSRIGAWTRAHRLVSGVTISALVVLIVLEAGVRVVTPDAMEVIEYSYTNPQHVVYERLVTNPVEAAADYQSLTSTAAEWNTLDPRWLDLQNRGFWPCQATHLPSGLPTSSTRPLTLRFFWHGLPIAVATHVPLRADPVGSGHARPASGV